MRRSLIDGIVWTAVGLTLVVHAGVIATLGWMEWEGAEAVSLGAPMLRGLVAFGFACVGGGALYLGARRLRTSAPE